VTAGRPVAPRRAPRTRAVTVVLLVGLTLMPVLAPTPAEAAPAPGAGGRSLAVSLPSSPVDIAAGHTGSVALRVVNPGPAPLAVVVTGRAVELENDGRVRMGGGPDPRWHNFVDFPARPVPVPGRGYADVHLVVHVPPRLSPDLYFIGFLVIPLATARGNLQVVNQIGWFVTVNVPGPRVRKLSAAIDAPTVVFGNAADGLVDVHNVGRASAIYWAENDVSSWPGGSTPKEFRFDPTLLPTATFRTFRVTGRPAWPVGVVTMRVVVEYATGSGTTSAQLVLSRRVVVINPLAVLAAALIVTGGIALWFRRRRQRRRRARLRTDEGRRTPPGGGGAQDHPRTKVLVSRPG
jgi:hypothetical protein